MRNEASVVDGGAARRFQGLCADQFDRRVTAAVIAELLAHARFGAHAAVLPRLAHLAPGAAVAGAMAFVMHGYFLSNSG